MRPRLALLPQRRLLLLQRPVRCEGGCGAGVPASTACTVNTTSTINARTQPQARRGFSYTSAQGSSLVGHRGGGGGGVGGGGGGSQGGNGTRPQLPFLGAPSSWAPSGAEATSGGGGGGGTEGAAASLFSKQRSQQQHRYFTTQRRRWLQYEALAFARYTLYFWAAVSCLVLGQFIVQQEWMERAHPTPPEWSFMSRMRLRGAQSERGVDSEGHRPDEGSGSGAGQGQHGSDGGSSVTVVRIVDHVKIMQVLLDLVARLEDPSLDGAGVVAVAVADKEASSSSPTTRPSSSPPCDISGKDEPWRRGYVEALLAAAETAEHVEGWVLDRSRNLVCPPDLVVGPSNPNPRPLPPGTGAHLSGRPREEDCEPCFPAPAELYLKLLHTRGLTVRQQLTAALAFANYLEYKQDKEAAAYLYGQAVLRAADPAASSLATSFFSSSASSSSSSASLDDIHSWTEAWLNGRLSTATAGHPANAVISQNLLTTLTAYATFQARAGHLSEALPLFVGLLQARRSLPPAKNDGQGTASAARAAARATLDQANFLTKFLALLRPPAYPEPPEDGLGPPLPGPRTRCEEAALHLHIGEILYASADKKGKGNGSWLPLPLSSSGQQQQQQQAREEGIAWTRDAVDMAEEQLHLLDQEREQARAQQQTPLQMLTAASLSSASSSSGSSSHRNDGSASAGTTTCRQCLQAGLDNWAAMVARLVREEERKAAAKAGFSPAALTSTQASSSSAPSASASSSWWPGWLTFWGNSSGRGSGHGNGPAPISAQHQRWVAEQKVVEDRRRRARELMEEAPPPSRGMLDFFSA